MSEKWEKGFSKTKKSMSDRFRDIFRGTIDDELYDDLTETLVLADIPYALSEQIIESAKSKLSRGGKSDEKSVREAVKQSALQLLETGGEFSGFVFPAVILVCGVNGTGKTTSIAKLANKLKNEGKSVLLAAADTFRAAASEQLNVWAERLDIPVIRSEQGQDAASVIFDAVESAKSRNADAVICDTAGRLHNKKNLMNELEKIYRVCEQNRGSYNFYTIIVLDAMSGQNSISQYESFSEAVNIDGIILTKTDGSAKGGILLGLAAAGRGNIWYVGTGEGADDLELFDRHKYIEAIFE